MSPSGGSSAGPPLPVAVIGAGYVGLTTAVCLAHLGHRVVCGEVDEEKVARLSRGEPTIVEEGLAELLAEGLASKRLRFVTGAAAAVTGAAFVFLCVPTPQRSDGSADVSFLESVAEEIGPHLAHGAVVVNKSTVPVSPSSPTPSSCARGRPSTTASIPTGSWSGPTTRAPLRAWVRCSPPPRRR